MKLIATIILLAFAHAETFEMWSLSNAGTTTDFAITSPLGISLSSSGASATWGQREGMSGTRIICEASTDDLQSWHVSAFEASVERAFFRLKVQHSEQFGIWSDAVDSRLAGTWPGSVDVSCISTWNSDGGAQKAGILVSPRHLLFVTHHFPAVNSTIKFGAIERTLIDVISLATTGTLFPDITVGVLDSDVSLPFAKVLAATQDFTSFNVPAIWVDQEKKLLVQNIAGIADGRVVGERPSQVHFASRYAESENVVSGDSGSPVCLVHGDDLILLCMWTYGGDGAGTFVTDHIDAINTAMDSLGGGYTLTEVDP